ncbi:hypothetical protein AYO46_09015 [Betaproteobacteria bacterium SCGC AG-212-J23]|nr:hypothetical protein AYO46_09015 [Betaproteobacteria bacterium SCGC AG-212-J23]
MVYVLAAPALAQEKPAVRFDNWLYFQRNTDDSERWQYRPRFYIPFALEGGGTFTQRIDLPMYYLDKVGADNPNGDWKAGIGDWFVEEAYLSPEVASNTKWSTSLRLIFPTGGASPFGSQQYQWAPSAGLVFAMPEQKLTFNPVLRYFMSYHATSATAAQVRRLDIYPTVTQGFAEGWSVSLWNENPIDYNEATKKWFVPLDVLLLKRYSRALEFGFGGAYGMKKDDPQYKSIVYGRVTLYF